MQNSLYPVVRTWYNSTGTAGITWNYTRADPPPEPRPLAPLSDGVLPLTTTRPRSPHTVLTWARLPQPFPGTSAPDRRSLRDTCVPPTRSSSFAPVGHVDCLAGDVCMAACGHTGTRNAAPQAHVLTVTFVPHHHHVYKAQSHIVTRPRSCTHPKWLPALIPGPRTSRWIFVSNSYTLRLS